MNSEFKQGRDKYREDAIYTEKNSIKLAEENPDSFVGIHGEKVVAVSPDLDVLIEKIKDSGVDPREAYVRFLSTKKRSQYPG